tara:strand:- start:327 stop:488 length:162 start_codon:yes stop_codon:yes gene_type:complete
VVKSFLVVYTYYKHKKEKKKLGNVPISQVVLYLGRFVASADARSVGCHAAVHK